MSSLFLNNAPTILEHLERHYGHLEKNEVVLALPDYIEQLYPTAMHAHANLFVQYAVRAMHKEGPQSALNHFITDFNCMAVADRVTVEEIVAKLLADAQKQ